MYVIWKDVVSVDPCGIGASADWQYRHFNASSCTRSLRNGQIFITRFSTAASAASTTMTGELRISVVCVGTDEAETQSWAINNSQAATSPWSCQRAPTGGSSTVPLKSSNRQGAAHQAVDWAKSHRWSSPVAVTGPSHLLGSEQPLIEGGLEKLYLKGMFVIVLADHSNAVITEQQSRYLQRGLRHWHKKQSALSSSSEKKSSVQSIVPGAACGSMRAAARITIPAVGTRMFCPSVCVVENAIAPTAAPKQNPAVPGTAVQLAAASVQRLERGPRNHRRVRLNRRIRARHTRPPFCISRTRCRGIA